MARKTSFQAQRKEIEKRYRGRGGPRVVQGESALSKTDRLIKQEIVCFLRAQNFAYSYIAEAVDVSESTIKNWLNDEKLDLQSKILAIQADMTKGAIQHLSAHAIELMEILLELARKSEDDSVALKATVEGLGMLGITKVNKSESLATQTIEESRRTEIDLVDRHGLVEALKDAPPEVQAKAAEKMDELLLIASEHTDKNVNAGA